MANFVITGLGHTDDGSHTVAGVDIGVDGGSFDGLEVCQLNLFADFGNLVGDAVAHFAAVHLHVKNLLFVGEVLCHSVVEDAGGESHEVSIGSHEVGLAAEHDNGTVVAVALCQYAAFVSVAVSAFGSHLLAFLTQEVDSFLEVAVAFNEGFLAVHHADTGQLAQLVHLFCCYVCHNWISFCC